MAENTPYRPLLAETPITQGQNRGLIEMLATSLSLPSYVQVVHVAGLLTDSRPGSTCEGHSVMTPSIDFQKWWRLVFSPGYLTAYESFDDVTADLPGFIDKVYHEKR